MKTLQSLILFVFLFIASVFCAGPAGPNAGGELEPGKYLNGTWTGYAMVRDRDGNAKAVRLIKRTCIKESSRSGRCTDVLQKNGREEKSSVEFVWTVVYGDNLKPRLKLEGRGGFLEGRRAGKSWLLEGRILPPFASDDSLQAQSRWNAWEPPAEVYFSMTTYFYAGIAMGSEEIFWQKAK